MNKIAASTKFQELMKKFNAPSPNEHKPHKKQAERDDAPPNEHKQHKKQAERDDVPPSVRKSSRDIKQPRRFESPISQSKPKLTKGTPVVRPANRAKENVTPPPRGSGRPKVTRPEPNQPTSLPPKNDSRRPEESAQSKSGREKPADRSNAVGRAERLEEESGSDEDFFGSASAPGSPPRGSAFSRVASRQVDRNSPSEDWSDSQFLPPPPANRDPRLQNNRNNTSVRRQFTKNHIESARRDPHPMYSRPEVSMRHPMHSLDASMRQPMHPREPSMRKPMHSRNPPKRQLKHSREFSMRHNIMDPDGSNFGPQPFVRLTDISRLRDSTQRWDNEFRRPQTPPEVQDLVAVEKAKLQAEISKMIDCPHFTSLEIVYALNSIQDTLVSKMERFCRKRGRTESLLRNTLHETMQESSRTDRDRVDAWLDSVRPSEKRPRLEHVYDYPRY